MTIFSAYFDESGTPDKSNRVLTMAGCVSSVKKWTRFEVEWVQILNDAGLPDGTIFHMNKFAAGQRPYQDFAGQSKLRAEFVSALVRCVKRNVNKAFSCSVDLRDWERMNERYCLAENLGYPYPFCGRTCIAQVMKWAQNRGVAQRHVEIYFESGAKHHGELERFARVNYDCVGPIFLSKKETTQFQAADLLAWKSRKVLSQVVEYKGHGDVDAYNDVQRSVAEIRTIPHDYGMHRYESLQRLVLRQKISLRSGQ